MIKQREILSELQDEVVSITTKEGTCVSGQIISLDDEQVVLYNIEEFNQHSESIKNFIFVLYKDIFLISNYLKEE